ncbi:hypothetical protein IFR04_007815 [Cadophora malorum]|uniref:Carbonic anhydrase n=1 Tax=Cadophora malorum TaxID=108018 RepID=A0A8H7WAU9_9HELO|nr:hypothetical protein IFR04_007815 [Cadophora malorum]
MSETPTKTIMQKLIERSQVYAQSHTTAMTLDEGKALPPGTVPKVTVIVSCCDPRCLPEEFFMLEKGFEYSIVRNAGGRTSEALRSIVCIDTLIGLEAVIVVHHTGSFTIQPIQQLPKTIEEAHKECYIDCGLTHLTNASIRASLLSKDPSLELSVSKMDFGEIIEFVSYYPFSGTPALSIPAAVREDVSFLKDSPLIDSSIPIYGCVYDIATGLVSEVL